MTRWKSKIDTRGCPSTPTHAPYTSDLYTCAHIFTHTQLHAYTNMHKKKKNRELLLEGSGATCKKPKPFGESVFALVVSYLCARHCCPQSAGSFSQSLADTTSFCHSFMSAPWPEAFEFLNGNTRTMLESWSVSQRLQAL